MAKEYIVTLEAIIFLDNADEVVNWHWWGWYPYETHLNPLTETMRKEIVVKTNRIDLYLKAMSDWSNKLNVEVVGVREKTK